MTALFASGSAVDIVLAVMVCEALWLVWRGAVPLSVMLMLLPGALMLLALRVALTGGEWPWIALWLAASLPVHLADVRRRRLI